MSLVLLGILNQQLAGGGAAGNFDLLETKVLSVNATTLDFTSLDSYATEYEHLQMRLKVRSTRSSDFSRIAVRVNGDTGANYAYHTLQANQTTPSSGNNAPSITLGLITSEIPGSFAGSTEMGYSLLHITDPFNSSKNTVIRSVTPTNAIANTTSVIHTTAATMTSLQFYDQYGSQILAGSRFSLYGYRKAA